MNLGIDDRHQLKPLKREIRFNSIAAGRDNFVQLVGTFRDVDTIARFGGDGFVSMIDAPVSTDVACGSLRRAINSLCLPVQMGGYSISIGASVGVAFFSAHSTNVDDLIRRADDALYKAKEVGRNQIQMAAETDLPGAVAIDALAAGGQAAHCSAHKWQLARSVSGESQNFIGNLYLS